MTDRSGDDVGVVAPQGLRAATAQRPFLGRLSCPRAQLVAGETAELVLAYEVGASGIADGGWLKITFKFYSDWALFQTVDATAPGFLSAELEAGPTLPGQSDGTAQHLAVRFDQKGHERPFQKAVIVDVIDGWLKPGDRIVVRLGDRRRGGPGARVQTFVERGFRFRAYVDPLGTSRFAAVPGDVTLDVVPGPPARLHLTTPRLARPGRLGALHVRAEDIWGNTCTSTPLKVRLSSGAATLRAVDLPVAGWATARIEALGLPTGTTALTAGVPDDPAIVPHTVPVTLDDTAPFARAVFCDLHVHSEDTVGINDTEYNLAYGRDVAGLDVLGYTANDFNVTAERWADAVAAVRRFDEPGSFVCLPGIEWCGNSCAGGDHNVVFLGDGEPAFPDAPDGRTNRSFEWNDTMGGRGIEPGRWPIEAMWEAFGHAPEEHLVIPHVGGRRANLDWHHPELDRLVEIASSWGHFGDLYEEVARRGYRLGASAAGDEHRGRCGGGAPGAAVFGVTGGLTGLLTDRLDRPSVGRALRARHTWATTGQRMVALVSCGNGRQGDEINVRGPATLRYRILGERGIEQVRAVDHAGTFWLRDLHRERGFARGRVRVRWGGARIPDRYRSCRWRGRIEVTGATIRRLTGRGFEHPEESCWRAGPTTIGFASETFGDADAVEIELPALDDARIRVEASLDGYVKVGDPTARNPFVHAPETTLEVTGARLLAEGAVRRELGGVGLFLAVERLTDAELPTEIAGEIEVGPENGPHGFRPVFLEARQIDDAKAWASAIYLRFAP
jgi:hypothetical protein